jgi:hypothetical protein
LGGRDADAEETPKCLRAAPNRFRKRSADEDGPTYYSQENCNEALVAYRKRIAGFADEYALAWNETLARIRGSAPGPLPVYAENQAEQWPLSIEI